MGRDQGMNRTLRGRLRRSSPLVLLVVAGLTAGPVAAAVSTAGVSTAGATTASATPQTTRSTPPANTWPKISHDAADTGVSPDPLLSTSNAANLGVKWMVPTGAANLGSAVVAYNSILGETLVYQGNEAGNLTAFNQANGQVVWSTFLGSAIRDTPLVEGNNVWVSPTFSPAEYKLNAATGAIECSAPMISTNNGTATMGPGPGGTKTIFIAVNDLATESGPLYAVSEASCAIEWQFTAYNSIAGSWDPLSFAKDAKGRNLVVLGTADPDSSVYAVNAATGKKVWSYVMPSTPASTDIDVAAGASITAPGVNGFADGVAYVPGKDGHMVALDLTTGHVLWDVNFGTLYHLNPPFSRSTPAVLGTDVIFGDTQGVLCLNAVTGAVVWNWPDTGTGSGTSEVLSATAVMGPAGQQVVAVANMAGYVNVISAATGSKLYQFRTGGFSVDSVADVDGNLLASSSDGYLYDFAVGGGNAAEPTTAVTTPAAGANVTNPGGNVTIKGTAAGGPIASVDVAVQSGGSAGPWWNGATKTWTAGYYDNRATVAHPGAASTGWSLALPVPTSGGTYSVFATANAGDGLSDGSTGLTAPSPSKSSFAVGYLHTAPYLTTTQGIYVAPGASVSVAGTGFAANEHVALSLDGATLATVTADGSGAFSSTAVPIPATATFGPGTLTGTGQTSSDVGTTTIDVSNQWTQVGDGPLGQGLEPNDTVLVNHVSPNSGTFLSQVWSYPTGAAIYTSPVVNKGVVYSINIDGTVTALDIHHSVPLWTYDAGSAVASTPVVASGLLVFGTTAGSVVAVSATTGALVWSTTTTRVDAAPVVAKGLVFVGADNGTFYALNVSTGKVKWQASLGGAVLGAAAVDATTGVVVVGSGHDIVALDASTGATLWSVPTGSNVTAAPTIDGANVLVGSGDGTVRALTESSGASVWSYDAGSPINVAGALTLFKGSAGPVYYVVGTQGGSVIYLGLSSGKLARTYSLGAAITGISSAPGFVVVTTADGKVEGLKYIGYASWSHQSSAPFDSAAAIVNGVVYVTGQDSAVTTFTLPGQQIP